MAKPNPHKRHKARRFVIQALYQRQLAATPLDELLAQYLPSVRERKGDLEYFKLLLPAICNSLAELDDAFAPHLTGRTVAEMTPVELSVLRMSSYELIHCVDVPYKVVINEALDLVKVFGAEDSHKFLNGVLDKLAANYRAIEKSA